MPQCLLKLQVATVLFSVESYKLGNLHQKLLIMLMLSVRYWL